jgi:hypothetical protein
VSEGERAVGHDTGCDVMRWHVGQLSLWECWLARMEDEGRQCWAGRCCWGAAVVEERRGKGEEWRNAIEDEENEEENEENGQMQLPKNEEENEEMLLKRMGKKMKNRKRWTECRVVLESRSTSECREWTECKRWREWTENEQKMNRMSTIKEH